MAILAKIPEWSRKALQGITYWTGHRRMLYSHYPLGESAFIAELCNLIFAHRPPNHQLRCEVRYSELAGGKALPPVFGQRARADIVMVENAAVKTDPPIPRFIIEVKRGSAPTREIDNDLKRLAEIGRLTTGCRLLLIVVSEAKRHKRFTTSDGTSIKGPHSIPNDTGHFRVRRTFKAAHAFTRKETAQYATLIEVYSRAAIKPRPSK